MWILEKTIETNFNNAEYSPRFRLEIFRKHRENKYRTRFFRYEGFRLIPFEANPDGEYAHYEALVIDEFLNDAIYEADDWEKVLDLVVSRLKQQGFSISA